MTRITDEAQSIGGPAGALHPGETRPVPTTLQFIVRQESQPMMHSAALTGGERKLLFETENKPVLVHDMRAIADRLRIDREGFCLLEHETTVADLYDDEAVRTTYYAELEELLRRQFDARRVVIFDSTRRSDGEGGAPNPDGARGPAALAHVDYTIGSGPQRAAELIGDEALQLLESGARILQINVWRPIRGPVERAPLAVADASSIEPRDLVATKHVFPDRVGEIYFVAHAPGQRWYYAPKMMPNEVLLLKGWDSLEDGRARFTPHSAFELPTTKPEPPPRESIETRTWIITD